MKRNEKWREKFYWECWERVLRGLSRDPDQGFRGEEGRCHLLALRDRCRVPGQIDQRGGKETGFGYGDGAPCGGLKEAEEEEEQGRRREGEEEEEEEEEE